VGLGLILWEMFDAKKLWGIPTDDFFDDKYLSFPKQQYKPPLGSFGQ
jgi:hypothetical protein